MNTRNRSVRILAGIIGMAGLAYPACAAVCPKGKGSCPYPGKCFLYTDGDANSVCDYTRSVSPGSSTGSQTPVTTTSSASASVFDSGSPVAPASSPSADTGLTGILHQYAPGIGIILFVVLCTILYHLFRSGRFGTRFEKPGPAFAISGWISLAVSEIVTYLLMGEAASGAASLFGVVYLAAGSVFATYLWKEDAFSREIILVLSALSAIFGFVLTVLIMPAEFAAILGIALGTQILSFGIVAILLILVLTFLTGRTFCAHICPVGAVQELASRIPGNTGRNRNPYSLEGIRIAVFIAAVLAALFAVDLIGFTGAYDFFALKFSVWSVVFLVLLAIATVVYRPVCRAICPFGLLFAAAAHFGRYRLERTSDCIMCKKCEHVCPAGVAGDRNSRRECYLCARCTQACPAGAIVYRKKNTRT